MVTPRSEWTHWHLTPRGWERGSTKSDFQLPREVTAPSDRVMTCLYREDTRSPMEVSTKVLWQHPDAALLKQCLEKYGTAPGKV